MARRTYRYNLGAQATPAPVAPTPAPLSQKDVLAEAHQNLRDALAEQAARLKSTTDQFQMNHAMVTMTRQEQETSDANNFLRFYRMINPNDPDRRELMGHLFTRFPFASANSAVNQVIDKDDAKQPKLGVLDKDEQAYLKAHGPGTADWKAAEATHGQNMSPTQAIQYGRSWDLLKKSIGVPSGTPEGINLDDYVKNVANSLKQPNAPSAGGAAPPPPSTPAPAAAAGWAGADLTGQVAPLNTPAPPSAAVSTVPATPATPPAAPQGQQKGSEFLQTVFPKTSQVPAAAAATNRGELNDMLNQQPETQFVAPSPSPQPTPTPPPQNKAEQQFYLA
jgi:hypothetical protein